MLFFDVFLLTTYRDLWPARAPTQAVVPKKLTRKVFFLWSSNLGYFMCKVV